MKMQRWSMVDAACIQGLKRSVHKAGCELLVRAVFQKETGQVCSVSIEGVADADGFIGGASLDALIGTSVEGNEKTLSFLAKLKVLKEVPFARPLSSTQGQKSLHYMLVALPHRADTAQAVYLASWRLKSDYLPCPLGTPAGAQWRNGVGEARVCIETQTVEALSFYEPSTESALDAFEEGVVVTSDEKTITVTCTMANGGACFGYAIQ